MNVLITGARGFIASNLALRLQESIGVNVVYFTREQSVDELPMLVASADCVFHLAGVNRPEHPDEFAVGNTKLTEQLCSAIKAGGRSVPVVYASSIHALQDSEYGRSKLAAENELLKLKQEGDNPVFIFRLPNVFGKWARPNYNSAVATFCFNIVRGLPIHINDPSALIRLAYVDDVVEHFSDLLAKIEKKEILDSEVYLTVSPEYIITVSDLVAQLKRFKAERDNMVVEPVGKGLVRALYATFISYLPPKDFSYAVPQHADSRGVFVEMLKTLDAGQFSFFTAYPGVTRGGHYHHSKTEKFLVIKGNASFRFRNMLTNEFYEIRVSGDRAEVVQTPPGWTHDVTNVGDDELFCLLWANEIFDQNKPDTFSSSLI